MNKTFKNIRESISSSQLKRLKKEYEPMRKIDMSKHKGQVEKTTAQLKKLKIGTLIDLYKENIPWISDIAKSLVLKDKRFAHQVESIEVEESRIMGLKKSSKEYKAGYAAAKKGKKYDDNPYTGKEPGFKRLNWSTGHNDFRADALRKAGKPNYGARGQFEEVQLDEAGKLLVKDFRMVIKIAIKHTNDMESAIRDIEKYKKGLSNHPDVMDILKKANEEVQLDEVVGPFQQVSKLLIKYGNNPKEVKRMMTKHMPYVTKKYPNASPAKVAEIISSLSATEEVTEADLTKTQIKKVHDKADELPKHDFIKRYGKDGDAVRYATATNIVKKKLGIEEERSPEVAGVLKKYIIGHPLRWSSKEGKKNKRDFIKLQNLALTDMGKFRKKFADMEADKGDDNYNQQAVRDVLAKAGLSKHLPK
jgi:hypothetical protein